MIVKKSINVKNTDLKKWKQTDLKLLSIPDVSKVHSSLKKTACIGQQYIKIFQKNMLWCGTIVGSLTIARLNFCICILNFKYWMLSLIYLSQLLLCQQDFFHTLTLVLILKLRIKSQIYFSLRCNFQQKILAFIIFDTW